MIKCKQKTLYFYVILSLLPLTLVHAEDGDIATITVTGTREETPKNETAETTNVIQEKEIAEVKPAHPSELLNRVPGVHVNVTGGEGHMLSIRQPMTTSPVYLYLENGIPTRSTGFFNHNAFNVVDSFCNCPRNIKSSNKSFKILFIVHYDNMIGFIINN